MMDLIFWTNEDVYFLMLLDLDLKIKQKFSLVIN